MSVITVGRENSTSIDLYYEDHGAGSTVVLVSGFPLTGRSWEKQTEALLREGHRVITYDRRGFGNSSQPTTGYDFETLASDLNTILTTLDLRQIVLIGASMGSGEVVRYLSTFGSRRVVKAVLLSPLALSGTETLNDEPVVYLDMLRRVLQDRSAFVADFLEKSYNPAKSEPSSVVSLDLLQYNWTVAVNASPRGTMECIVAWRTDFRRDLSRIDIPVLIISGGLDQLSPLSTAGAELSQLIQRSKRIVLHNAPHNLFWTHADEVNRAVLDFIDN